MPPSPTERVVIAIDPHKASWTAAVEATIIAMRALVEHRDDLVKTSTQTVNRLHVLLTHLTPGGAPVTYGHELCVQMAADLLA